MTVKGGRESEERKGGRNRGEEGCLCLPGEGWRGREGARCTDSNSGGKDKTRGGKK